MGISFTEIETSILFSTLLVVLVVVVVVVLSLEELITLGAVTGRKLFAEFKLLLSIEQLLFAFCISFVTAS